MQRFFKSFLGVILGAFFMFSGLNAESLKEGKDYIVLKTPLNVPPKSIVEIFNVGCPHCAKMGEVLPKLFATIPQEAVFLPYHILTGSAFSAQASEVLAVAVAIDEERNLTSRDIESYFRRASNAYFDAFFKKIYTFQTRNLSLHLVWTQWRFHKLNLKCAYIKKKCRIS